VLVYKPVKVVWKNIDLGELDTVDYLKVGTLVINSVKCEHRHIPVRVIYEPRKIVNSYNGYFIYDPVKSQKIYIKVLQLKIGGDVFKFSHLEIDKTFSSCFGELTSINYVASPYFFEVDRSTNKTAKVSKDLHNVDTFLFGEIYSNNFRLLSNSAYQYKGLVAPSLDITNMHEWHRICDPRVANSYFEKFVLGRSIMCGITDNIASVSKFYLNRGESIWFSGSVLSGSIFLIFSRVGGGIVKVSAINKGRFSDVFRAPSSAEYSVTLSTNISMYNYPYLNFNIGMWRLNRLDDVSNRPLEN